MPVSRSVLRKLFHRIKNSLGFTLDDIALWCDVKQPAVAKWRQWAEDRAGEGLHPPSESHFKKLCDLYREAECVSIAVVSTRKYGLIGQNGQTGHIDLFGTH
jgi:hypothetical protein